MSHLRSSLSAKTPVYHLATMRSMGDEKKIWDRGAYSVWKRTLAGEGASRGRRTLSYGSQVGAGEILWGFATPDSAEGNAQKKLGMRTAASSPALRVELDHWLKELRTWAPISKSTPVDTPEVKLTGNTLKVTGMLRTHDLARQFVGYMEKRGWQIQTAGADTYKGSHPALNLVMAMKAGKELLLKMDDNRGKALNAPAAPSSDFSPLVNKGDEERVFRDWVPSTVLARFQATVKAVLATYVKSKAPLKLNFSLGAPQMTVTAYGVTWGFDVLGPAGKKVLSAQVYCGLVTLSGTGRWYQPQKVLGLPEFHIRVDGFNYALSSERPDFKNELGKVPGVLHLGLDKIGVLQGWMRPAAPVLVNAPAKTEVEQFVGSLRTWFEYDGDLAWSTRAHRGQGADPYEASPVDLDEARRLGKALKEKFGDGVYSHWDHDQEWVFFHAELKGAR